MRLVKLVDGNAVTGYEVTNGTFYFVVHDEVTDDELDEAVANAVDSTVSSVRDYLEHEMEIDTYEVEHMFDRITSWTEICLD